MSIEGLDALELFGAKDSKLNIVKQAFPNSTISHRGTTIKISGEKKDTQNIKRKLEMMIRLMKENEELPVSAIKDIIHDFNPYNHTSNRNNGNVIVYGNGGKKITARTRNQKRLVELAENNDIVFAVGPAGTGKTYTAVAIAVRALKNRLVKKIILTRPAVEAGESLGFLPGDLKEKIDPYLRPLYDALDDMIPGEKLEQFMNNRTIEVAPLAFMRGRTLDNAYIILDEAQNTTSMQLKMFLTRLGPNGKCIITGDLSQVDLPKSQKSGLRDATELLGNLEGIATIHLDAEDVVRHRLVKSIIQAYARKSKANSVDSHAHHKKEEDGTDIDG